MPAPDLPDQIRAELARVGARVRHLRLQAGITQDEVVRRSGVDRRTLQRIEAGSTDTRLSRLVAIAAGLGLPLAELVADDESPAAGPGGASGGA